jgi:hypothetical protein
MDAVEVARNHWGSLAVNFWPGDVTRPEAIPEYGDVSVVFELIEHVRCPEVILSSIKSPVLFASVPDQYGNPWSERKFPFHLRHYTMEQFEQLLRDTGWEPVERMMQLDKVPGNIVPWDGSPARTLVIKAERSQ